MVDQVRRCKTLNKMAEEPGFPAKLICDTNDVCQHTLKNFNRIMNYFSIKGCLDYIESIHNSINRWINTAEVKSQDTSPGDLRFDLTFWLKFFQEDKHGLKSKSQVKT